MNNYDIVVIGAGPGGYTSAIRAAQLGKKVAIIEKDAPGGVCLNWGCIPSKNLIHQAEVFRSLSEMESIGVKVDRSGLDFKKVYAKSRDVVKTLSGGVSHLLKKNAVDMITGTAVITQKHEVTIDSKRKLTADNIIVATGSRPLQVPGFECDEQQVLSSTGILQQTQLPKSLVILGGGAIGCEFAYVMNSFGVKVTLVESLAHLLPTEDSEVCAILASSFQHDGIEVLAHTQAQSIHKEKNKVVITLSDNSKEWNIDAEKVLVVFGRAPNTENLGLEKLGITIDERGYIPTNEFGQTPIPSIYAIGDVTRTPALAHVATKEGEVAVNCMVDADANIKGINSELVPSAIYCEPQVAGFGLREQDAKKNNIAFKKSVFHYSGAGKTIAIGKPTGLIKVLCDKTTDEILGAHIVGHNATELIHELLLAKNAELLPKDITHMIHAHPTISEGILEAMQGINGKPVHG